MAASNTNNGKVLTTVEDRDGWTLVNYGDADDYVDDGFLLADAGAEGGSGSSSSSATPMSADENESANIDEANDESAAVTVESSSTRAAAAVVTANSSSPATSALALRQSAKAASAAASRTRAKVELSRTALNRRNQVAALRSTSVRRQAQKRGVVKCPAARSASKKC